MAKKFLYFQPEYVDKFKCDGSKCNARCCKNWRIDIDAATYKKYSKLKPKSMAKEITSRMKFDDKHKAYVMTLNANGFCPMLTENNLCGIQLNYGVSFLSKTCSTYPRHTNAFGKFFERSLTMTCPVAAEMILFNQEPMTFEFVEVPEKIHSRNGKIALARKIEVSDIAADLMLEVQVAMISILQERTLSINQRLIVLCFFVDRLEEIYSNGLDEEAIRKLIAVYESKEFLSEQVPLMLQSVSFNAEKFIELMMNLLEAFYGVKEISTTIYDRVFLTAVINTLNIKPDEDNQISLTEIAANYERLAEARKKFWADYSTFLENYLVNELFFNLYPWKNNPRPSRSFSVYLLTCKVFELFLFSATQNDLSDKKDLLKLVDWYINQIDHAERLKEKIFAYLEEHKDFFELMDTLLEQ